MKRENGYYWISQSVGEPWQIAEWIGGYWFLFGSERMYLPDDFEFVDENRIIHLD